MSKPTIEKPDKKNPVRRDEEGQLSVDIFQTKDEIIIVAPIAGVKPEDVTITITDDVVTIKGERRNGTTMKKDDCIIQECFWGTFSRSVVLPTEVDTSKAEAEFNNNVLILRIPRIERVKTRVVKINKK